MRGSAVQPMRWCERFYNAPVRNKGTMRGANRRATAACDQGHAGLDVVQHVVRDDAGVYEWPCPNQGRTMRRMQ